MLTELSRERADILYLEVLELLVVLQLLPETGVEDEELGVAQPTLQLFDAGLQLPQHAACLRGELRRRKLHRAPRVGGLHELCQGRLIKNKQEKDHPHRPTSEQNQRHKYRTTNATVHITNILN